MISTHGSKIHMKMVWKFFCGLSRNSIHFSELYRKLLDQQKITKKYNRIAIVHMMHCAYESKVDSTCTELVECLGGVINVRDLTLDSSDCSVLGYVTSKASNIVTEYDLSYCHIGPTGTAALAKQLEELDKPMPKVKTLR